LKSNKLSFLLILFLLNACDSPRFDTKDRVVARVYGVYLRQSELAGITPSDAGPSDSIAIVNNYINNWIRNQLLLQQADKNLTAEQKDFSRQLRDYRNSLIIFKYESEYIRQNLDSLISLNEVTAYFENNQENFRLKEDIVRFIYVKLKEDSPALEPLKKLFMSGFEDNQDSITYYAMHHSDDYAFIQNEWTAFNRLLSIVPVQVDDIRSFLENESLLVHQSEPFQHLIYFTDHKSKDSLSPLEYVKDDIELILLNRRKRMLIKDMHREIYDQAMQNNDFEFF
jgi:hypothetical protein